MRLLLITLTITLFPLCAESGQAALPASQSPDVGSHRTPKETKLKWLILGTIAAQAADIATTSVALHRGCVETMYYGLQNKWAIGGMKAGGTVALTVTLPMFHNKKPKLAKALAWAEIASGALGAAINSTRLPHCR